MRYLLPKQKWEVHKQKQPFSIGQPSEKGYPSREKKSTLEILFEKAELKRSDDLFPKSLQNIFLGPQNAKRAGFPPDLRSDMPIFGLPLSAQNCEIFSGIDRRLNSTHPIPSDVDYSKIFNLCKDLFWISLTFSG